MLNCWQENPKNRPTFTELVKIFSNKLDASTRKNSLADGYIDSLLLSDASGISNLAFQLDTVNEDEPEDENVRYVDPEVDKVSNKYRILKSGNFPNLVVSGSQCNKLIKKPFHQSNFLKMCWNGPREFWKQWHSISVQSQYKTQF